ncbi:PIR protein [Plasmodium yoelii]|uniref:PIR protein n=2 Tax=Plasmodium yoelii TaxID=5861 RepID=A0AAF0B2Z8_PLAYO|nr:PIR protein [Plasmodium yoelii]WBY60537.1 PIR protein [Plasmodium yoelii yoelii]CDU20354.1 YIR protein [Plasmodium yoelii]VTZ81314.1 PIR protein [Plasmodium yoelii]|eukprot:XP_022810780.1 PIR protein [Plasmodium yoelii]
MNKQGCKWFNSLWFHFPDELKDNENYKFSYGDQNFKQYCTNNSCDSNLEKINAACLYLFNAFFGNHNSFKTNAKNNFDVVDYIIIWLSYMLSLKQENGINKLNDFYTNHIATNAHYNNTIHGIRDYKCYKQIIDKKKDFLDIDINNNIISKFYEAFKLLYEMYYAFDGSTSNCKKCSKNVNQFVETYENLYKNYNNTDSIPYKKILFTLSTDYNKLKNECNGIQSFPSIETTNNLVKISEQPSAQISATDSKQTVKSSEVTSSSSSIVSKLISIPFIFVATLIFLGISYKYSLFGFRKRPQKQQIREKLKK